MTDIEQVTREDAVRFLENACRNWQKLPPLTNADFDDVARALERFTNDRAALAMLAASPPAPAEVEPVAKVLATYGDAFEAAYIGGETVAAGDIIYTTLSPIDPASIRAQARREALEEAARLADEEATRWGKDGGSSARVAAANIRRALADKEPT